VYLRDLPGITLEDLSDQFNQHLTTWGGVSQQIAVRLEEDQPHLRLGEHEVTATKAGLASFATFFDIPPKFFGRLDPDQQQFLLSSQINRADSEVTVQYSDGGIYDIRKAGETRVRPQRLIDAALTTFPAESPVVDHWLDQNELRVDVIFPEGFERGTGGDPQVPGTPGIGDITRGGIRIGQDRKINSAPWIQPYLYRLVCTNGMEIPDQGLRVSATGATEREIEMLFEAEIARAVDRLEADIHSFYDLRNTPLGNDPTGALRRAAQEQNLPLRTIGRLEDLVPALADDTNGREITMFDVVNLMTNQANDPSIGLRSSTRRNLQRGGGNLVNDHAERCSNCHSRLGR
jgi:hypothetical protein